jgi:glutathione S-transferase
VGTADVDDELKAKAQRDAQEALAAPLEVYNTFFLAGRPFIGGDHPSIADIRVAATLEFLRVIDYPFPEWAEDYMARMEETLGDAYSEPVADVRGYVESMKGAAV